VPFVYLSYTLQGGFIRIASRGRCGEDGEKHISTNPLPAVVAAHLTNRQRLNGITTASTRPRRFSLAT
jgi:hypothetical protein